MAPARAARPIGAIAAVVFGLALLAVSVVGSTTAKPAVLLLLVATFGALVARTGFIPWRHALALLVLIILLIPIRRYAFPVNLPFQLEPYRLLVILLAVAWGASLLVDRRTHFRRTGFEGPLVAIVGSALLSVATNPSRIAGTSSEVDKRLMFLLSFVLVLYLTANLLRQFTEIDYLVKTLVVGGAIVALFAIVEARTGYNVFNHVSRVLPILRPTDLATPDMLKFGSARLRVFGSAQHPIALSALFVMITPLAIFLWWRSRQRRWALCTVLLITGCASTVSRTGIMMFAVVLITFLCLRPKETRRLWPALVPALIVIHVALPGTLGAIKNSFTPPGGVLSEQQKDAGQSGSGRLADVGPSIKVWKREPLVGQGYGTRNVVGGTTGAPNAQILDDQWLTTLLETGVLGFFGWIWFFARAVRMFGSAAKRDESPRGWLLASLTAAIAAYAVGMLTYDAFSFVQVSFVLFIFVGLGAALLAEEPLPLAAAARRTSRSGSGASPAYGLGGADG